jgi:hypothetical protein
MGRLFLQMVLLHSFLEIQQIVMSV